MKTEELRTVEMKMKMKNLNLEKITKMVTEKELKEIDEIIKGIYEVDYNNNYSTAYNLGFGTVANLNGSGYINLVRIIDCLNDGGEIEDFARFILSKALSSEKIEALKKELGENRNQYIRFLYL